MADRHYKTNADGFLQDFLNAYKAKRRWPQNCHVFKITSQQIAAAILINKQREPAMTKYSSSASGVLPEGNEYDPEDAETGISWPLKGSHSLRDAQFLNNKMLEKMRPRKVAKFKASRRLESDF